MKRIAEVSNNPYIYSIIQRVLSPIGRDNNFLMLNKLMNLKPGETVLDVGCGTGVASKFFPSTYVGIDPNDDYLSFARKRHGNRFFKMDATKMTFLDESFNYVFSANVFHHLSNEQVNAAVSEMQRVCVRGGGVFIEDTVWPKNVIGKILFRFDLGEYQRSTEVLHALLKPHGFTLAVNKVPRTFPQEYSIFEYRK